MRRAQRPCFDHDGEPLLTASEAAKRLGTNTETIRRWMRKGVIGYLEIGPYHRKRLRQCEVDRQRRISGAA
jgi:excisionase family DNA binding protein